MFFLITKSQNVHNLVIYIWSTDDGKISEACLGSLPVKKKKWSDVLYVVNYDMDVKIRKLIKLNKHTKKNI